MTLMLHAGANEIDFSALRELETPPATPTHVPIEHHRVIELVRATLSMFSHEVTAEHYGVTPDGMRFFGLMELRSKYTGYTDLVGLRNSHDKSFPISVGFGSRVFVCDNLSFIAQTTLTRRHTAKAKLHLPGLVVEMIEPLTLHREHQARTFERYKHAMLTDERADHCIMSMFRQGIINMQRIPDVLHEWEEPTFAEFDERNAWRMLNAATYVLSGKVMEKPNATPQLFKVIDGVCEQV